MMKKLAVFMMLAVVLSLSFSFVSAAWSITQSKNTFDGDKYGYGELTLTDLLGMGNDFWKGKIVEHTEACAGSCLSIIEISTNKDIPLYNGLEFYTIKEDNSKILQPIRSYRFQIQAGNKIDDKAWTTYTGEVMPKGKYFLKIIGDKRSDRKVDWILNVGGEKLNSWAVWGAYSNCYQESANQTNQTGIDGGCRLNYTGKYANSGGWALSIPEDPASIYDGNFGTGTLPSSLNTQTLYINYTKPLGALQAIWTVQEAGIAAINLSIPSSCFNYNFTTLILRTQNSRAPATTFYWDCLNSTAWQNLRTNAHGTDLTTMEEAMIWNGTFSNINLDMPSNNSFLTNKTVQFNCSASPVPETNLTNISLFTNSTAGAWARNQTQVKKGPSNSSSFNVTYAGDGRYLWACEACDADGDCGKSTNYTLTVDTIIPNVTIYAPNGSISATVGQNMSMNYSVVDTNVDTCWYDYNTTNVTIPCSANSSFLLLVDKTSFKLYANDSAGNINWSSTSWTYGIVFNHVNYTANTSSGQSETFSANVTINPYYTSTTAYLIYNSSGSVTNHLLSTADLGENRTYSTTITIPSVPVEVNNSFYFSFLLSSATNTTTVQSSSAYNQTVSPLLLSTNCTLYPYKLLSFWIKDEETLANLSGTINTQINLYSADRMVLVKTYNATLLFNGTTYASLCVGNNSGTYSMDYSIQFYNGTAIPSGMVSGGYYIKYKHIQNFTLTNVTMDQNITLYDLLAANGYIFQTIVRGASGGNGNILVDVQKQYLSTADYKSVESYITDSSGNAVTHLIPSVGIYNFLVSRNGHLLGTFNNYQVKCDNYATLDCTVRLNLFESTTSPTDYTKFGNIQGTFLVDQALRTLYFTWATTDGQVHTVDQDIVVYDSFANQTVCSTSSTGTSGTFTCVIPALYGNTTFMARTYVHSIKIFVSDYIFYLGVAPDFKGADVILELLMYSSLVLMMMSSPVLTVIGAMVGLFMSILLIYFASDLGISLIPIIIFFIAAGGIILIKLGKRV